MRTNADAFHEADERAAHMREADRQTTIAIDEQPDNAAMLERELLTVKFAGALTPEEKRKKLKRRKVQQLGLGLEAENEEELNGWFPLVDFGGAEDSDAGLLAEAGGVHCR